MVSDVERFWSKVDRSAGPDGCWVWQGARNPKGYGQFRHGGQMRQAHRWILGVLRGAPLRWDSELKEEACHRCDNRACCNPVHLYAGSHAQNMQDCLKRGRNPQASKTHCPQGHEYNEENTCWTKSGRSCRACARARTAARRAAAKANVPPKDPTRCTNGHPWTEETTYLYADGGRYCRKCNSECQKRRRAARDRKVVSVTEQVA